MRLMNTRWLGLIIPFLIPSIAWSQVEIDRVYCSQSGGTVEKMAVEYNTSSGFVTGNSRQFCLFTADNGLIVIGLESFAANTPSIAATYMKKLPEIADDSGLFKGVYSNPSFNVCKNLGGAMVGFVLGGDFTDSHGQSDICVFGDGSMVSAWSLIYMANHRQGYDEIKNKVKAIPLDINMPN
ncbi:MAG: hypothetical protein Q8R83_08250 [Legionellaceae bacterium]|nr:hypothetical protein [Legionellaceae bacterium]